MSDNERGIMRQLEVLTAGQTVLLDLPAKQILTLHDQISGSLISYWRICADRQDSQKG
jgi:hypothetical protein